MEFDHLQNKRMNVGSMAQLGYRIDEIWDEISKCDLVCVLCHRLRTKRRANPNRKAPANSRSAKRAAQNKRHVDALKRAPCTKCGKKFDPCQMDFDHLRDKKNNIGSMIYGGGSIKSIDAEIAKCVLLCAVCHRTKQGEGQ